MNVHFCLSRAPVVLVVAGTGFAMLRQNRHGSLGSRRDSSSDQLVDEARAMARTHELNQQGGGGFF